MSLSYNSNINNIKPYHTNENFSQQQAPQYTPFIQEQTPPEPFQPPYQQTTPQFQQTTPPFQPSASQLPYQPYPSNPNNFTPQGNNTSRNHQYNKHKYDNYLNPPPVIYNNDDTKIKWLVILKSIIIYTILFLIISSVKMDNILQGLIPYLGTNIISNMICKGLILSILIVIIQKILN